MIEQVYTTSLDLGASITNISDLTKKLKNIILKLSELLEKIDLLSEEIRYL